MIQVLRRVTIIFLAVLAPTTPGAAQDYPDRVVRIVNPYPPGGSVDVMARLLAQKLGENLGQQFIVENRSGGGGNTGSDFVAKAEPDGYTLLFTAPGPLTVNQTLYSKLTFDPATDFAPIALFATAPIVLIVNPGVPANNVQELIALARKEPGKINFASARLDDDGFLRELATWAEVGLALANRHRAAGGPEAARGGAAGVVEGLALGGVPEGLGIGHFNALRGRDGWKESKWLGIVGRTMPSEERLARSGGGDRRTAGGAGGFRLEGRRLADARDPNREWVRERTVPGREDGLEQALLDMIAGDELAQAIGRARLVRRPLEGVAVDIMTNHPVPGVAVNELIKLEEMMKDHDAEALAAARGIVLEPGAKGDGRLWRR